MNYIVGSNIQIKIKDISSCIKLDQHITQNVYFGDVPYNSVFTAPEIHNKGIISTCCDVWSVGIIFL